MSQIAVVSYIPALHQGYLKFFENHPGDLYILGPRFVQEHPRLDRDIRALEASVVANMVQALNIMNQVHILDDDKVLTKLRTHSAIVLPDEDLNRGFAKKYLSGCQVEFVPTFLRWHGHNTATGFKVQAERQVSRQQFDREMISKAQKLAPKSPDWWRQIGAVLVVDGQPVINSYNRIPQSAQDYTFGAFGDPRSNFDYGQHIELVKTIHAEVGLVAESARRGIKLEGASVYVTTFPCPGCAKVLAVAGIKHVYYHQGYSVLDAEDVLKANGVELIQVELENPPSS